MSIKSKIDNLSSGIKNSLESAGSGIKGFTGNVVRTTTSTLGNLWEGGFAGISEDEVNNTLIPAIESYCNEIEDQISTFNAATDLTATFAGTEMQTVAQEYVEAIKALLVAYVSSMRTQIKNVHVALEEWNSGTHSVAQNVSSNVQDIMNSAANIKLD